ncbi:MAG: NAD(P)-dependent oxidoreductase, partial [Bacteroidota bacterium]
MSDRNNLFPVFLKLEMLETLIVGGGNVGLEKLEALLKNSPAAKITLIGREIRNEIKSLAAQHSSIKLIERNFRLWDAWDKDIIILATDDKKLHESIRAFTRPRNVLINVADTPDLCDFYLG